MVDQRILNIEVLTAESFEQYGDVISPETAKETFDINYGATKRFDDLAHVDTAAERGRPGLSIFRSTPLTLPISIKLLECHPIGSQAFIPLGSTPYLVVVAPPCPSGAVQPDWDGVQAFLATDGMGVNYRRGVWHHYSLALGEQSDFLVVDRLGDGDNVIEVSCPQDRQLIVNPDALS